MKNWHQLEEGFCILEPIRIFRELKQVKCFGSKACDFFYLDA